MHQSSDYLLVATWHDIATRTIPDAIAIGIALLGAANRLLTGLPALALSLAAALVLLLLLTVLHARGLLGGGDAKLIAALCLGLSLPSAYRLLVATALAGGALALLHLILRRAVRGTPARQPLPRGASLPRRIFQAERWRISRHGSLPYAVAIACGGLWAILAAPGG